MSFGASKSPQPIFTQMGIHHNRRKIQSYQSYESVIGKTYHEHEIHSEQKISVETHIHEEFSPSTPTFEYQTTLWAGTDHSVVREDLESFQTSLARRTAIVEEREHKMNQLRDEINSDMNDLRRQQRDLALEKQRFREKHGFGLRFDLPRLEEQSSSEEPVCPHCRINLADHNFPWISRRMDAIKDAEIKMNAREKYVKEREFELNKRQRNFDGDKRDWRQYYKRLEESVKKRKAELNGERALLEKEKREYRDRLENFQRAKSEAERRHRAELAKFREQWQEFNSERTRWAREHDSLTAYKHQITDLQHSLTQMQTTHEAQIQHYRVLEENLVVDVARMGEFQEELTQAKQTELDLRRELNESIETTRSLQRQLGEMVRRNGIVEEHLRRAEVFYTHLSQVAVEKQTEFLEAELEKSAGRMDLESRAL